MKLVGLKLVAVPYKRKLANKEQNSTCCTGVIKSNLWIYLLLIKAVLFMISNRFIVSMSRWICVCFYIIYLYCSHHQQSTSWLWIHLWWSYNVRLNIHVLWRIITLGKECYRRQIKVELFIFMGVDVSFKHVWLNFSTNVYNSIQAIFNLWM